MEPLYREGDIVRLDADIGEIPAGLYVITEYGWIVQLDRLGENEDGDFCTCLPRFRLTLTEAEQLHPMELNITP